MMQDSIERRLDIKLDHTSPNFIEAPVDWRGRSACTDPHKHGGLRAAVFVLGLQAFEIMAIAAVGNNLITYAFNDMHFSLSKSANVVTNFVGTVFLLSLVGGFLADSYLGSFWTMLIFGVVELMGFILLSIQAHIPQLRPPQCSMVTREAGESCDEAEGYKALVFFLALYLVALGSGCVKPNMIAHGADQFNKDDPAKSKKLSTYFNAAYFSFCIGELVALTLLIWVQTRSGMDVGFGLSAAAMTLGLLSLILGTLFYRNKPPQGSIFTPLVQVFVAAYLKRNKVSTCQLEPVQPDQLQLKRSAKFRFLDKACLSDNEMESESKESEWRLCTPAQVERVKTILSVFPIFACTIIFNTILAQLQTFSVQQGVAMNNRLGSFRIPPASLQAIPYFMLVFILPLYERVLIPFTRKLTKSESGINPLQRIGVGLFTATFSMVAAALVENKRRQAANGSEEIISIFWISPQYLIFGVSEMFTAVGLIEFFYKEAMSSGMQSFLTAITYCSYSFGFYLSSLLVSLVNSITSGGKGTGGWLSRNDLNKDRLDLFYWVLAGLSLLNFFNFLFWSRWYSKSYSNPSPIMRNILMNP